MEQIKNLKKQLIFDDTFLEVSSNILREYKLDETPEELVEKLGANKPTFAVIFMDIVRNLFGGAIKENELSSLLKDRLNISKEAADRLTADTKGKILPLMKEVDVPEEQVEKTEEKPQIEENNPLSFIKKPLITNVEENEKILKKDRSYLGESIINKEPVDKEEVKKNVKKPVPSDKIKESVPQPKRPSAKDSYREPIE